MSEKAGQPVTVEIYSNPAFHYLDLTCAQRLFFVRSGEKVVIPMLQNNYNLDISFKHSSHSPCIRDFNAPERQKSRHLFLDRSGLVSSCSLLFVNYNSANESHTFCGNGFFEIVSTKNALGPDWPQITETSRISGRSQFPGHGKTHGDPADDHENTKENKNDEQDRPFGVGKEILHF